MGDSEFFIAWIQEDNMGQPNLPYLTAREVYKYRVFRDDFNGRSEPITEAMTYQEAARKVKELIMLTKGREYVRD
jgi:hypothetical protein